MKIRKKLFFLFIGLSATNAFAQQNGLTGSPYSLFGLGTQTGANVGKYNGLARSGVAIGNNTTINLVNPASLGTFNPNLFLFDVGLSGEINSLTDRRSEDEKRISANFSNLAFAFPLGKNAGVSISLLPSSSVGYSIIGLEEPVENSIDTFSSNVFGSGSINDVRLSYGRKMTSNWSLGGKISYLWGSIDEEEVILLGIDRLFIEDENYYNGVQFGIGTQYSFNEKLGIGANLDFGTVLFADKTQTITRTIDSQPNIVRIDEEVDSKDFELPYVFTIGGFYKASKSLNLSFDYKQAYWDRTNQSDNIGEYVDQKVVAIGGEYIKSPIGLRYVERINFRGGLNYDTGYLEVDNTRIDNVSLSLGLGLPVGSKGSMINLSYTRGFRGQLEGILVQENLNQFSINLSLSDIWFQKTLFN